MRPLCIAGMHRSGTSMVARMLNLCGLWLGEERDIAPAMADNPEGFWENTRFVELNDEILNAFGGAWDVPVSRPQGWERDPLLEPMRTRAVALAAAMGDGRRAWGWKDPRNSLTLPFWRDVVPGLKIVVCLRNPLEVALSLRRRNHCSWQFALALWLRYAEAVVRDCEPAERLVTHYDAYFPDPIPELHRVCAWVGLAPSRAALAAAAQAAAPELRHQRFTAAHLEEANLDPALRSAYDSLSSECGWIEPAARREPEADLGSIDASALARPGPAEGARRLETAVIRAEVLEHELQVLRPHLAYLTETLAERDRTVLAQQEEMMTKLTERDALIRELQEKLRRR